MLASNAPNFSHGNALDRLAGNNELIFDLEHAVKDLIDDQAAAEEAIRAISKASRRVAKLRSILVQHSQKT